MKVPTLNVAGWWDQEDFYGPLDIYASLEKHDTGGLNYLVVGPWNHGGWTGNGTSLGPIPFGSDTAAYFRDQVQAPFFAFFLKDKGTRDFPEALTFESGANQWRRWSQWPPAKETKTVGLYFGANEVLGVDAPPAAGATGYDSYVSDPAHPVPYRQRPIQATYFAGGSKWSTWLVEDQRFVDDRADVLSWETPPLASDLTIAGEVVAQALRVDHRHRRRLDREADRRLSRDVPGELDAGRLPADGVERGVPRPLSAGASRRRRRFRPNQVQEYRFSLHTQNYTFKAGHRVMVQVQSTWFPLIDRNPQTFTKSIFDAEEKDFVRATHRVYRSARYPSRVEMPVVTAPGR